LEVKIKKLDGKTRESLEISQKVQEGECGKKTPKQIEPFKSRAVKMIMKKKNA
jgi:hypothetical protein